MVQLFPVNRSKKTFGMLFAAAVFFIFSAAAENPGERPAQTAGSFYPADKEELAAFVDKLLEENPAPGLEGSPFALLVPHAGYVFSGPAAARAYNLLKEQSYDTVILIGPSHKVPVKGASVWGAGYWETPLGRVRVDGHLSRLIAAADPVIQFSMEPHMGEHSLEVQLPFLQRTLSSFEIVPVVLNDAGQENCTRVAAALAEAVSAVSKKVLIIVSTDFSHYETLAKAKVMDEKALDAIRHKNPLTLARLIASGESQLCGDAAVLAFLELLKKLQPLEAVRLEYSTSAKASGREDSVVGYGAFAFMKHAKEEAPPPLLSAEAKRELLHAARKGIGAALEGKEVHAAASAPELQKKIPAFVTVKADGELRGCIGTIAADRPVSELVTEKAVQAAFEDSRFEPITEKDFPNLEIEIALLKEPFPLMAPEQLVLGRHGILALSDSGKSGLLLPQVAVEQEWTREEFLDGLCVQKAGLGAECWKDPGTRIFLFETDSFSDMVDSQSRPE